MTKLIFSILLIACFVISLKADDAKFVLSPNAIEAYHEVMNLRFTKAEALIGKMKKEEPSNLIRLQLENYIDFFTVYIREDQAQFERLEKNKDARLELIRQSNLTQSPYFLYLQANIRLHWAMARLKFEEYATAFLEVNKAFKLLEENERLFPDFLPNKKDLGILHAMVGTIPDNYKWGVKLLTSLNGTIEQGKREIEWVLEKAKKEDFLYKEETVVLYAYLLMHLENDSETAWAKLNSGFLNPKKSLLACFTLANVAMRTERNDEAVNLLKNRPVGSDYFEFPYLDFMLGQAKLRRLDNDSDIYFKRFLENFKGRHFIKEAYQKLSWHALINGNESAFKKYQHETLMHGNLVVGSDKDAQQDAENKYKPNISLVKARLLFDGGYYARAYKVLLEKSSSDFNNERSKLEFTYRLGRILHKLGRTNEAIRYYNETIEKGRNSPYYYACNAALQTGLLFESLKNYKSASKYFNLCTSIEPNEHKTGLHQQAKAGLGRIKGRN
jgi:predicted negative regulator of RcsB-dependent stress response